MLIEEEREREEKKSGCEGETTLQRFELFLLHSIPINCHHFSFLSLYFFLSIFIKEKKKEHHNMIKTGKTKARRNRFLANFL